MCVVSRALLRPSLRPSSATDSGAENLNRGFLLFEASDFVAFPAGGQLTMARHIMHAFAGEVALVGVDTDGSAPIGSWKTRLIDGNAYPFFAVRHVSPTPIRPWIPARLSTFAALNQYRDAILGSGVRRAFCQGHETLLAIARWQWDSLCYDFPGVASPLAISRYPWARPLAMAFDASFFRALRHVDAVLATADPSAVEAMCKRSHGAVSPNQVTVWPTRVDTQTFRPGDRGMARQATGIDVDKVVLVTTGRVNWVKGWPLLLDCLAQGDVAWQLVFVGDGEDRHALLARARAMGLQDRVVVTGFRSPGEVADYIRAADVFVMASFHEGFSTAMIEALACGAPIVSTDVSSATTIIDNGVTGHVISGRDAGDYARAVRSALAMPRDEVTEHSLRRVGDYATANIRRDLIRVWPGLQGGSQPKSTA